MFVRSVIICLLIFSASFLSTTKLKKVDNFTLKDYNGKEHSLSDYKDSKAIVLMFIATQCPVSNAYNSRMTKLYNEYKNKNVVFIGINSNKQENIEEIKDHASENGLKFTILKDKNNIIADKLGATVTPEVYILNSSYDILYHGRIDDSRRESDIKSTDTKNALDEILNGKNVSVTNTKAFGCTIKKVNNG